MDIKIIGCGGIGSNLAQPLCRFLSHREFGGQKVTLIDGDVFDEKNRGRQIFNRFGNKAKVTAESLSVLFPHIPIEAKQYYVTDENLFLFIREGDIVFSCVDNHKTRKRISDHCKTLQNVVLISGGNEYSDGTVQVYIRQDWIDRTPPITYLHPEIEKASDRSPDEMSCQELAEAGSAQLSITNLLIAAAMLSAFWLFCEDALVYSEQYIDLKTGNARAIMRKNWDLSG